jgi:hypothetical protein
MKPLEDPKEIIDYLEKFYRLVGSGIRKPTYEQALTIIRMDLSALQDAAIREQSLQLFTQLEPGGYLLQSYPQFFDRLVRPDLRKLIDYLRSSFQL